MLQTPEIRRILSKTELRMFLAGELSHPDIVLPPPAAKVPADLTRQAPGALIASGEQLSKLFTAAFTSGDVVMVRANTSLGLVQIFKKDRKIYSVRARDADLERQVCNYRTAESQSLLELQVGETNELVPGRETGGREVLVERVQVLKKEAGAEFDFLPLFRMV